MTAVFAVSTDGTTAIVNPGELRWRTDCFRSRRAIETTLLKLRFLRDG